MMPKRARQIDVARLAGVSPATVSVILNDRLGGNVRISAETRQRVWAAVEELGYVADPIARTLAGGQNGLLSLFCSVPLFAPTTGVDRAILAGIEQAAEELGYHLLLFTGGAQRSTGQLNQLRMAEGAILLGPPPDAMLLQRLSAEAYPFVLIGRQGSSYEHYAYVTADYTTITHQLVSELISYGHRAILCLGTTSDVGLLQEGYTGYLIAHRQAGLHQPLLPAQTMAREQVTSAFLQQALANGVTAFVMTHSLFIPFWQAMAQLGKTAPADLSLALVGDPPADFMPSGPITGCSVPYLSMGQRAVMLVTELIQRGAHAALYQESLPCPYRAGNTIAAPKRGP